MRIKTWPQARSRMPWPQAPTIRGPQVPRGATQEWHPSQQRHTSASNRAHSFIDALCMRNMHDHTLRHPPVSPGVRALDSGGKREGGGRQCT